MKEVTSIRCTKNLYNKGLCFIKGKVYEVPRHITTEASLMETTITNELGEPHTIGCWWRDFEIVEDDETQTDYNETI